MRARPTVVVIAIAAVGASLLLLAGPHALPSAYAPAALGAAIATHALLRDLRPRDRLSIGAGAGILGFFAGSVSGIGPFPASLAFAGAMLPSFALFLAGVGRERLAFELSHLEETIDDPRARPAAIARATEIREEARRRAIAIDPDTRGEPEHAGDPRAVLAYAAQVIAYARALDGAFAEAVAALDPVPTIWMHPSMRPLMIGNLSFFLTCSRSPEAALTALDRLPEKQAAPELRAVLRAARAAALAQLGRAEEALALVGRSDADVAPPDRLAPRYAILRAFCDADEDRAREALGAVASTPQGRAELSRFRPAAPEPMAPIVDDVLRTKAG